MENTGNNYNILLYDINVRSFQEMKDIWNTLEEKDIALFDALGSIPDNKVYNDIYVVVLCLNGKGIFTIEGTSYELTKNSFAIGHPNKIVQNLMVSCDFKCCGLLMSPKYFQCIVSLSSNVWKAIQYSRKKPVVPLSDDEKERFLLNYEILRIKLAHNDMPHYKESLKLFLQSLVFEFHDILLPKAKLNANEITCSYTSGENLFNRFIDLIIATSPQKHNVKYYADKLCITPKYLSAICKKESGKTALNIIDEHIINYIKQKLNQSEKSIKEIANETGFDNLSFFGKFVRRKLGMSPKEYRLQK